MVTLLLTILGGIFAAVVGGITIYEFMKRNKAHAAVIAAVIAAIVIAALVLTFFTQQNRTIAVTPTQTPTVSVTVPANTGPTDTSTASTPTALTSPIPTTITSLVPTEATPQLATAKTLIENRKLSCNCSDRVVATITKIVIQPDQNRMLWSMTFFNNSQQSAYAAFADSNFYLQEGDQINEPAPGAQQYDATGSVIGTFSGISLQAGETQQVIITFSFVPYTATPYTLVSIMQMDCCGQEIAHFDPLLFPSF